MPNPQDRIYITYKTRMMSESRLRSSAYYSNVMIVWYSLALIVISLIDLSGKFIVSNFSMISAAVSIAVFAMSLFIYGERYSERADQFRSCYLKLQALHASALSDNEKAERYSEILEFYPNHSDSDYDEMLFDAWIRGQSLSNSSGPIKITLLKIVEVGVKRLLRCSSIIAFTLLPLIFGWAWIKLPSA